MKLSLDWIQEFVDLSDLSLGEILQKINTSICETEEAVSYLPHLETIVPVKILSLDKHPQADKLQVAQVTAGVITYQVVTAATNVKTGDIVPLALPGTVLGDKTIGKSELRGVASEGMFCSGMEIGINDDNTGVFILRDESLAANQVLGTQGNLFGFNGEPLELGQSLRKQWKMQDVIIDIDNKSITHRPDLWSHFGFARELAAQFGKQLCSHPLKSDFQKWEGRMRDDIAPVTVSPNENAHGYFAIPISSVRVLPSIMKFRSRLTRCGLKSISNVVDVSNYLLLECGQPTHFFDRCKLAGDDFAVSFGTKGEKLDLLDESTAVLSEDILVIRNGGKPVAVAGVMGGMNSAVFDSTVDLVLESAVFRREDIRKSIRKTGIRSDSSVRYEKGLDSHTCIPVIMRALELLTENGNPEFRLGKVAGFQNDKDRQVKIRLDLSFLRKKLGKNISSEIVEDILRRLGFKLEVISSSDGNSIWDCLVPTFRHNYDITIREDLVEEIGRTIGYASIDTIPLSLSLETPIPNELREWEKRWRNALSLRLGYHEVFNYSFASPKDARFEGDIADASIVNLENEMPLEHSVLRTSIYPSLLRNAVTNQDRFDSFGIYEIGRTYNNAERTADGLPREDRLLGILHLGSGRTQSESLTVLESDFLSLRSSLEKILNSYGFSNAKWAKTSRSYFHPNAALELLLDGMAVGEMGILHNRMADEYGLRKRPILAKLRLDLLSVVRQKQGRKSQFSAPSAYPQGHLDISLVLNERESTSRYASVLQSAGIPEIDEIWVHDLFRGGNLASDQVSVTYRVSLMPYEGTFTSERLKAITESMLQLARENGYSVR